MEIKLEVICKDYGFLHTANAQALSGIERDVCEYWIGSQCEWNFSIALL